MFLSLYSSFSLCFLMFTMLFSLLIFHYFLFFLFFYLYYMFFLHFFVFSNLLIFIWFSWFHLVCFGMFIVAIRISCWTMAMLPPQHDIDLEEDPLESLAGGEMQVAPSEAGSMGMGLQLTESGIRAILNRKVKRSKPLLEYQCHGCKRTSFHRCKFLPNDYVECLIWKCYVLASLQICDNYNNANVVVDLQYICWSCRSSHIDGFSM